MNFLLFYLLGCSFSYSITFFYFNNEILDNTYKFQEQLINNKKFDQNFLRKATITFYVILSTFYVILSWLIVVVYVILKLQLLYYIILNLFKK